MKLFSKKIIFTAIIIFAFFLSVAPIGVLAVDSPASDPGSVKSLLNKAGNAAKYNTSAVDDGTVSFYTIAGGIISVFLSLLSIMFILLLIYGGYLWMNARGNTEQVTKAQDLIKDAVIGLVIIVAAYAITYFVLATLTTGYVAGF